MIRRLTGSGRQTEVADVLVVGGGTAGLVLATRLSRAGLRCVVLESGGERRDAAHDPLNDVEMLGHHYSGAGEGRARTLGGTSTIWGGGFIPYQPIDLEEPDPWPIGWKDVSGHVPELERIFGIEAEDFDRPDIARADAPAPQFLPRVAKWPPFAMRNMARHFAADLAAPEGPVVWLDATVTEFAIEDGRLRGCTAHSIGGDRIEVRAAQTVIAAGAIESTRLLLLADLQAGETIFAPDAVLGRTFSDHLSTVVGRIVPRNRGELNRVLGMRFVGRTMRTLRFEPAPIAGVRKAFPPGFMHVSATSDAGGFGALRGVFRAMQKGAMPSPSALAGMATHAPWIARAAWWRMAHRRVLAPADAHFDVHCVIEQRPDPANRITLSQRHKDRFGLPLAAIDWRIGDADMERCATLAQAFGSFWRSSDLAALGAIKDTPRSLWETQMRDGGDIFHPCGSTRMGVSPRESVVDAALACHRLPGMNVLSTATFPRSGGANPTMTLLLLALRMAERLARKHR